MADIINDNNCCPSIEDGASWPILILNYQPSQMANNFLFLHKKMNISDIEEPLKLSPVFFWRIVSILFKPSQLQIALELNNELKKTV